MGGGVSAARLLQDREQTNTMMLSNPSHSHHVGVVCDGCGDTEMQGTRYKCRDCSNYDLCEACYASRERLEIHDLEHTFIPIPDSRAPEPMLGVGDGSAMDSFVSSFLHSSTMLRQAIRRARDLEALHELALDLMFEENIALALQISEQEIKPAQPPASEAQIALLESPTPEMVSSESKCAICLSEWEPGDNLKRMPGCTHVFHNDCLKQWCRCQVCRTAISEQDEELEASFEQEQNPINSSGSSTEEADQMEEDPASDSSSECWEPEGWDASSTEPESTEASDPVSDVGAVLEELQAEADVLRQQRVEAEERAEASILRMRRGPAQIRSLIHRGTTPHIPAPLTEEPQEPPRVRRRLHIISSPPETPEESPRLASRGLASSLRSEVARASAVRRPRVAASPIAAAASPISRSGRGVLPPINSSTSNSTQEARRTSLPPLTAGGRNKTPLIMQSARGRTGRSSALREASGVQQRMNATRERMGTHRRAARNTSILHTL